ncbi:MAG: XRE family transcriptional regulator [Cytophagaceae bacterium]|nr:MAG: XRE family transcriptional regulator [Cytophagaceae bacterium]
MFSTPKQPSTREVFAQNLRRARRSKDISQEVLALEAGLQRGHLSRVERAAVNITFDTADELARAIGVPLCELVDPARLHGLDDQ